MNLIQFLHKYLLFSKLKKKVHLIFFFCNAMKYVKYCKLDVFHFLALHLRNSKTI